MSESDLLEDAETGENTGKSQSEGKSDGESEYRIDPRTGKRYKVLKGMDLSGMTAKDRKTALKMGMTITQLRETVDQDPEFQNMDNTSLTPWMSLLVSSSPIWEDRAIFVLTRF